jgi:hypothetical protein
MRISAGILPAVLLVASAGFGHAQAAKSACVRLLPPSTKALPEVPSSFLSGAGQGLTAIYDGGLQEYIDGGVLEAAQKTYSKGKVFVTVTAHTMKDAASARKFVEHFRPKGAGAKTKPTPAPGRGFSSTTGGMVMIYWASGRDFVTIMVSKADKPSQALASGVLKTVSKLAGASK